MFYCEVCTKLISGKSRLLTTQRKLWQHPHRPYALRKRNEETGRWEFFPDNGGNGYQIKKEVRTCENCYNSPLFQEGFDEQGNLIGLGEAKAIRRSEPVTYQRPQYVPMSKRVSSIA